MNAGVEAALRKTALRDAKNAEGEAASREFDLRTARFRLFEDLVRKYEPREEPVVTLAKWMLFAAGESKGPETWESFRARIRQSLEAEVLSILAAGMAGSPDAPKLWRRYEDAFRRIAQGVPPPRALNLEVRTLLAYARASNDFRETPAPARVLAMVAEELGQKQLSLGSKKKVLAVIAQLSRKKVLAA